MSERALRKAEQIGRWRGYVQALIPTGDPNNWPDTVLAIDAEREALWAVVDEMAGKVEDFTDALGDPYRQCKTCEGIWEAGQAEEHYAPCWTDRARELKRRCGRE